jgi:alpha-beta hydrolase superfamily lysophospholipase
MSLIPFAPFSTRPRPTSKKRANSRLNHRQSQASRTALSRSVCHGDDDRNVPFQQTTDLVEKLRAQNVAFEELIIPDEIHDLLRWSDWVRSYKTTADFFDRKLAATPQP